MKKIIVFCIFSLVLYSCSQIKTSDPKDVESFFYLREEVFEHQKDAFFLDELNPDGFESKAETFKVDFGNPEMIHFLFQGDSIYPHLKDFGSLDTRIMLDDHKNLVNRFFVSIQSKNDDDFLEVAKKIFDPSIKFLPFIVRYEFSRIPPFSSWILGSPVYSEDFTCKIPARIKGKSFYMDINIYIATKDLNNSNFFIDQIQFGEIVFEQN